MEDWIIRRIIGASLGIARGSQRVDDLLADAGGRRAVQDRHIATGEHAAKETVLVHQDRVEAQPGRGDSGRTACHSSSGHHNLRLRMSESHRNHLFSSQFIGLFSNDNYPAGLSILGSAIMRIMRCSPLIRTLLSADSANAGPSGLCLASNDDLLGVNSL